ncbi:MAG: hypothetical protein ACO37W_02085 [Prochlorotrichaceae cyanobacterium]
MSTQPNASVRTTLPQDRTQEQLSPVTGGESNLWLQSLILHAPTIGLGLAIATGLCLLMGISLRILLNPNIHAVTVPEPAAVSPRGEDTSNPTIQETDEAGVRIVFPATKSFLAEADSTETSSSRSRTIALLLGLGGFGLTIVGFLFWRSIRRQVAARSSAPSSNAIVLQHQPRDLAPPSRIATTPPPPVTPAIVGSSSPPMALPQAKPTVSALPAEELPVHPVLPTPPLTIHYPSENDTPVTPPPRSVIETATGEPINLVDLMDIRKRRPHS